MKNRYSGTVSVIIINFRGVENTIECIQNLKKVKWPSDKFEIVVVDNASGDDSLKRLSAYGDTIKLVESAENLGFAGGCNLGARHAKGEYLAFLNNDAKPDVDWVTEAIRTFDEGPDVGAVASKVLDWQGTKVDYVDGWMTWYGMGYKPACGAEDTKEWDTQRDVLFGTGAAMFIRASVFNRLDGFDENYFMFYEDVDLGWRLNLLGYRFRFQPRSLAYHKHHASIAAYGSFREEYLLYRNSLYTLYKNLDEESLRSVLPGALLLLARRSVAKGAHDSTMFDVRKPGDDAKHTFAMEKSTAVGLFAMDQFLEHLPQAHVKRKKVQTQRVRSDRELLKLFGDLDEPIFDDQYYLEGYRKIVQTLDSLSWTKKLRILIVTGDAIGKKLAGPAIRAWHIAKALSREADVRLTSMTSSSPREDATFEVFTTLPSDQKSITSHEEWADVIIIQGCPLEIFPALAKTEKILIVDIYDPMHLEQLEQGRTASLPVWDAQVLAASNTINQQIDLGDFFLCASERQRHFWLGQLAARGRVNAYTYARDTDLNSLLSIVPFGISEQEPVQTRHGIKGAIEGIAKDDKVIVWGGGIYSWFDPETLIRAVAKLSLKHSNVKLFFMGVKHPNPDVPLMKIVTDCYDLARELGVLNTHVFFNENWVEFDDRQNYLLDADVGVSTHFEHLETTFSFRTRILDYLWSGLPIVTTRADSFGDLVEERVLGCTVPERDIDALVDALEKCLFDTEFIELARANVASVREEFRWSRVLAPLLEFCRAPKRAADKMMTVKAGKSRASSNDPALPPGLRRDIQKGMFYLREEGVQSVVRRFRARNR